MVVLVLIKAKLTTGVTDTEIYNYQISPRYLFKLNYDLVELDNIFGIDLIHAYYYSDRMSADGKTYYKKYKMTDQTAAFYFNSNIKANSVNKFSIGARYQGNWLKTSRQCYTRSILSRMGKPTDTEDQQKIFQIHSLHIILVLRYKLNQYNTRSFPNLDERIGRSFRYPNLDERIGVSLGFSWNKAIDFKKILGFTKIS